MEVPQLGDDVKHGIVGEVLDLIAPVVEPNDPAILFPFLTAIGNLIGDQVYIKAGGMKHSGRLFTVLVGETSKGRKGTAWAHIRNLLYEIEPEYVRNNIKSGLSTGEGLITEVRDDLIKKTKNSQGEEEVEIDEGVKDKRRLIIESEFARLLRVMNRDSNIISTVVRDCWDTGNLYVITKVPYKATGAHISLIGHITQRELDAVLTEVDRENGFANRFMWVYTFREKIVPLDIPWESRSKENLKYKLHQILSLSSTQFELNFSDEARDLWLSTYETMAHERPGLIGVILARGEPIILRIAVIYAFLDNSGTIEVPHLKAAIACYQYLEKVASIIFKDKVGDSVADKILEEIQVKKELTQTDITRLFSNNMPSLRLEIATDLLLKQKRIFCETQMNEIGRPTILYKVI